MFRCLRVGVYRSGYAGNYRSFSSSSYLLSSQKLKVEPNLLLRKGKRYSAEENELVEELFQKTMYPEKVELDSLAVKIGRTYESVNDKFERKRLTHSKIFGVKLDRDLKFSKEELAV